MPINYLNLQPQLNDYCDQARLAYQNRDQKVELALSLLHRCADEIAAGTYQANPALESPHPMSRCARPDSERVDEKYTVGKTVPYALLASDGSQIISSHHDALPISLINIAGIYYQPQSGIAPEINVISEFVRDEKNIIDLKMIPEDEVNMIRDVAEADVIANWDPDTKLPVLAIGDGPLELFHEPRSSASNQQLFQKYLDTIQKTHQSGKILGGYIDKPRADLVVRMLEMLYKTELEQDLTGVTDADIFFQILEPDTRSAIFQLNSPSSVYYTGSLALHFFYLNVGRVDKPWIVRVEITKWTADQSDSVQLLHQALIDQCRLMGSQPYPYLLHRAHEEAVVHMDEKEKLTARLSFLLQQSGVEVGDRSYKLSAKELGKRTRMK
ncbi:MAG: DNA double-strand break repair nuclease NurA [Pelolinea sp.]|nr:DNA double-strand break repair nuclease NurA [Pelolinea sp.]